MSQRVRIVAGIALACLLLASAGAAAMQEGGERWTPRWSPISQAGGPIAAIAIDPGDATHILLGGAGSGIWTSHDAGATWTPIVDDVVPSLVVGAIVFNPIDRQIVYAATSNTDGAQPGAGILKSADGGATWTPLSSTAVAAFSVATRLAISADGGTLLAAAGTAVYRSVDGGASWTQVFTSSAKDIAFLGGSSVKALLTSGSRVHESSDGGVTWQQANFVASGCCGARTVLIGVTASSPSLIYVTVDLEQLVDPATHTFAVWTDVYRSIDGGATYQFLASTGRSTSIWAGPSTAPGLVVLGGASLRRSTDGGTTWTAISNGTLAPDSVAAGQNAIAGDPGFNGAGNRRVYFATNDGVYKTDDITTATAAAHGGYTSLNTGLHTQRILSAAGHRGDGTIVAGTTQGVFEGVRAGGTWSWTRTLARAILGPRATIVDPTDSQYQYAVLAQSGGASTSELFDGGLYRTTDGGATWGQIFPGSANVQFGIALDPNDPNTMFLGDPYGRVHRSRDVRTAASPIGNWSTVLAYGCTGSYNVIGVAAGAIRHAIAACQDGTLQKTDNASDTQPAWSPVAGLPPGGPVTRIVFADTSETVYVAFGRATGPNIWKSATGGAAPWVAVSGSGAGALPDVPVRSFTISPRDPSLLFAGTDRGVYSSADGGATWRADGRAGIPITDLFWSGIDLVAATDGHGLYVAPGTTLAMTLDEPRAGQVLSGPIIVRGWALDQAAAEGTGIDGIHVWAIPLFAGGTPVFAGVAATVNRPDVASVFGAQYANAGFELSVYAPPPGPYTFVAYARSSVTQAFDVWRQVTLEVAGPESRPAMAIDVPSSTVGPHFQVRGWALDAGTSPSFGVDAIHVYAVAASGGAATFLGVGTQGIARPDVAAVHGARFLNSGYTFDAGGLAPGGHALVVYAHSVVSGQWSWATRAITVTDHGLPAMSLDTPQDATTVTQPLQFAGWAADLYSTNGPGVDVLHVWAIPTDGGQATFAGVAATGGVRNDVGAAFGPEFATAGFTFSISGLDPGTYQLVVYAHSTVTGTFSQWRVVTVTIQ